VGAFSKRAGGNETASATGLTGLNTTTAFAVAFWNKQRPAGAGTASDVFRHTSTANASRSGYRCGFGSGGLPTIRVCSATASNDVGAGGTDLRPRRGIWRHYVFTFDNASNTALFYMNGNLLARATSTTDIAADASVTTLCPDSGIQGGDFGFIFDLQVLPNYFAYSASDARQLMNPRSTHHAVRARWFGVNFRTTALGALVRDESGNGNNLTVNNAALQMYPESPYFPTFQ